MKQVYKLLASAAVVLVGVTNLSARNWSPATNAVTQIEAGKKYALQGIVSAAGNNRYLQGTAFTEKSYLSSDGVFEFVPVEGVKDAADNQVYYLKVSGKTKDQYVSVPGNKTFYTSSTNRAWKVVVKEAVKQDPQKSYDWQTTKDNGGDTTIVLRGKDAYVRESMADNDGVNKFDLSTLTFTDRNDAVVIVSYQSKNPKKKEQDAEYDFFLTNEAGDLSVNKGTNYSKNVWNIFEVEENNAKTSLNNVLDATFGEGFDIDGLVDATKKDAYVLGTDIGQYDAAKYAVLKDLYTKAKAAVDGGSELTETELDKLAEELPKAFNEFKASGKPLTEGYYIVESYRSHKETGYDGGALYDEGAVKPGAKRLLWTYKGGATTYKQGEELDHKSLKFIWKVEKDNAHPGFFFFKNMQTERYINKSEPAGFNQTVEMSNERLASYNIVANRNQAGFFTFYSPDLWRGKGFGGATKDRWEFGGLHPGGDHERVVVWDWQAPASAFYARTITQEQIDKLLSVAQQGINNDKANALVNQAQAALDKGYAYMAVNEQGTRLEFANSGDFSKDNDPGLVTSADHLKCPMADKDEGKDLNFLLDGDANTFFHSTWHGGEDAWKGNHFLQFQLEAPQQELLLKWVKRVHDNANGGAPAKVTLWGTKSDEALDKGKENKTNDAGEEVMDYDAWKKQGWDSLAVSTFNYPYAIKVGEATKNNYAGVAYFKVPAGYKNFRLEVVSRANGAGADGNGNRFFYGSEFRVYKGAYDEVNSLNASVPKADIDALNAAIAKLNTEVKAEKATKESIEALQKAYDQFLKNYPEPKRVTDALAEAQKLSTSSVEGAEVGYYKEGAKAKLEAVITSVKTQLEAQVKTKAPNVEQINAYLAELNAGLAEFAKQLIMPEAGVYRIQSASAEKTREGRMITAINSSRESHLKMWGRVLDPNNKGVYKDEDGFSSVLGAYWDVQKVENGYTLKNVYSGLYAAPKAGQAMMTQSETPYVFSVTFAKTPGCFNFVIKADDAEAKKIYVNAESDNLVLWNSAEGQDNSAFKFLPATEDINKALDPEDGFRVYVQAKVAQIITLPVNAGFDSSNGQFYTVIGQDAESKIQLAAVTDNKLNAGQAYVYKPAEKNESNFVTLYPTKDVNKDYTKLNPTHTPGQAVNGLTPVFENTRLNEESGIFNRDHSLVLLSEPNESVAANTGYFDKMPVTDKKGDAELKAEDTITSLGRVVVLNGKAGKAGVYTLSGVRVNNANHLPAGVYIVNGKKQVVK
ncbi:MAG: hypothetical protein HXK16_01725 [Alloprevotella sp.]|nr:hypothetical protein [Alloprevotella sp.]